MAFNSNYFSTPLKTLRDDVRLRWNNMEAKQLHRGEFSKDRDRILYSKSFLRLRGKTQVFMLQGNDYIRTRMTHTLEVNQIAKTIAIALGQNVELVEAIALGHDVGHTPFGHIGERTLRELLSLEDKTPENKKGFKHNLQALRLLCELEKGADYPDKPGLNLTKYVLWGIAHHSSIKRIPNADPDDDTIHTENPFYDDYLNKIKKYWSIEGLIVSLADEIAQRHHDIEDSLRYGVVSRKEIVSKIREFSPLFEAEDRKTFDKLTKGVNTLADPVFTSVYSRLIVNVYVKDAINNSRENFRTLCERYEIKKQKDFADIKPSMTEEEYKRIISFSDQMDTIDKVFQNFLKSSVLSSFSAQAMDGKGKYIIEKLYSAFKNNPEQLPDNAIASFYYEIGKDYDRSHIKENVDGNESILYRCIVDYIGGMTDRFAYEEYDRLYGTKVF